MNTRHASRWFWLALALVCLTIPFLAIEAATHPQGGAANANIKTAGGLTVVTFTVNPGTIKVYLPDDMRAGDTISGTVIAEPNGQTPEERAKNKAGLQDYVVAIFTADPRPPKTPPNVIFDPSKGLAQPGGSSIVPGTFNAPTKANVGLFLMPNENAPAGPCRRSGSLVAINEGCSPISQLVFDVPTGRIITADPKITPPTTITVPSTPSVGINAPDPKMTPTFTIPLLGQTGRLMVVTGPFDGDSSNTNLDFDLKPQMVSEFAAGLEYELRAESPRKAVFEAPSNVTGPIGVNLKEGNVETKGTYRNVGVNLTAPKTNLLKGEKTTLTVQVSGLEGIKEPVPLTLECKGVITMEGGIFQPLVIQPSQVGADGRYTTTRGITGVQTGGWEATATVVTGRFNVWLQDDSDPNRLFHFNSFTGEYIFACGGGSCRGSAGGTSSQPPTGSSEPPPPVTLTGTGRPKMKGCIITLSHNAPDRRVFARLDACTKTGDASVETPSPKTNSNITDKNTTDNTVPSPPPK